MVTATGHDGICPSCEQHGPVGSVCVEAVCARRKYHFIPRAAWKGDGGDSLIGRTVGDYLLTGMLGRGGFGKVYRALQLPILMPSAVKLMDRPGGSEETTRRLLDKFRGEAQALAQLGHPNIVRLLKYGQHDGAPYLVMELVDGARTLKAEMEARAQARRRFEPDELQHVLGQLLDGLEAAHDKQIVHRDIKPENVMLQTVNRDREFVRILDFGLAKFVEARTETSQFAGTPMYFAPEQIDRRGIGPWTDLYAVGVIAFEMLTGQRPFDGQTFEQILVQKMDPSFDPMAQLGRSQLAPGVEAMLRKAMARQPADRYRSAGELRSALGAALGGPAPVRRALPTPLPVNVPAPERTSRLGSEAPLATGRSPWIWPMVGVAALLMLWAGLGIWYFSDRDAPEDDGEEIAQAEEEPTQGGVVVAPPTEEVDAGPVTPEPGASVPVAEPEVDVVAPVAGAEADVAEPKTEPEPAPKTEPEPAPKTEPSPEEQAQALLAQATTALDAGEHARAGELLEQAVALHEGLEGSEPLRAQLTAVESLKAAESAAEAEEWKDAWKLIGAGLEAAPEGSEVRQKLELLQGRARSALLAAANTRGERAARQKNWERASNAYSEALKYDPDDSTAQRGRSRARRELRRGSSTSQAAAGGHTRGAAPAVAPTATPSAPSKLEQARALYAQARSARLASNLSEAARLYKACLRTHGGMSKCRTELIPVLMAQGKRCEALVHMRRYVRSNPGGRSAEQYKRLIEQFEAACP